MSKVILVDFDGTLATYVGDPPKQPGTPIHGAKESLDKLKQDGWKIDIFSGRANFPEGVDQIKAWLSEHQIPYDDILIGKPKHTLIVDDSALAFNGDWSTIYSQVQDHPRVVNAAWVITSHFYPSLVNPPDSHGGDTDVVIPESPEWKDSEENWHFPYVKRPADWDVLLPLLFKDPNLKKSNRVVQCEAGQIFDTLIKIQDEYNQNL